jgi:hypothetical protein
VGYRYYEGRNYPGFRQHCALVTCANASLALERQSPKAAGLTLPQALLLLEPVLRC